MPVLYRAVPRNLLFNRQLEFYRYTRMEKRGTRQTRTHPTWKTDSQLPDLSHSDLAINQGGSTVVLELMPERLKISQTEARTSLSLRCEQLAERNGALEAEIGFQGAFHKEALRYVEKIQALMYENHYKGFRSNEDEPLRVIQLRQEIATALIRAHDRFWERVEERQKK